MTRSQVDNMNVITHACSIGRLVVVTPNVQVLATTHGNLRHVGQQVVGNTFGVFANQPTLVCANRIEITQDGNAPSRVGRMVCPQHVFNNQLGVPIGVGCAEGMVLGQGQLLRYAVNRCRRTEYQGFDIALSHGLQKANGSNHIVVVIRQGVLHRFPNSFQTGKVDDCRRTTLPKCHHQGCPATDITLDMADFCAANFFDSGQCFRLTIAKIVQNRDVVTRGY